MRIWLITIGEPVPIHPEVSDRLHRTGLLAFYLAQKGHDVVWWTSAFDHFRKRHIAADGAIFNPVAGLEIRLLRGCGYRRTVSLARLIDQKQVARKFGRAAAAVPPPEIVVAALPVIELCRSAIQYGERARVPVVLDMRDMWPDIFLERVPHWGRPIAKMLLFSQFRDARIACSKATAITGITEPFVEWGVARGNRRRTPLDVPFPLAHVSKDFQPDRIEQSEAFWDRQFRSYPNADLKLCFMGGLSSHLDLDTIIDAAAMLEKQARWRVLFVICGTGDQERRLKDRSAGLPNVIFAGWVDGPGIQVLQGRCDAGLDPLPNRFDFLASVNNKAVDYMSAGLPIISSPRTGLLADLIAKHECGASYSNGDAKGLTEILEQFCRDRAALDRMSAKAKALFETDFAADLVHERLTDHLKTIIGATSSRGETPTALSRPLTPAAAQQGPLYVINIRAEPVTAVPVLPAGYEFVLWRPTLRSLSPPTAPHFLMIWAIFHWVRIFRNRDYAVLLIAHGKDLVHRSCCVPAYFRWPFMKNRDVQISTTWTHPDHRGQGLAAAALLELIRRFPSEGRNFWYVSRLANRPSLRTCEKAGFRAAGFGRRTTRFGSRWLGCLELQPAGRTHISGATCQ